jgi:hypothetical protein
MPLNRDVRRYTESEHRSAIAHPVLCHKQKIVPAWGTIRTLRAWGIPADEAHFVGSREKAPILKALGAHIFFDDQEKHVLGAAAVVPAGHVPGPHDLAAA